MRRKMTRCVVGIFAGTLLLLSGGVRLAAAGTGPYDYESAPVKVEGTTGTESGGKEDGTVKKEPSSGGCFTPSVAPGNKE